MSIAIRPPIAPKPTKKKGTRIIYSPVCSWRMNDQCIFSSGDR